MPRPRYHQNKALSAKTTSNKSNNPHEAIIMPSEELEEINRKWEESIKTLFSVEQIEDFKRVRSYEQFRDYCEANDILVMF